MSRFQCPKCLNQTLDDDGKTWFCDHCGLWLHDVKWCEETE